MRTSHSVRLLLAAIVLPLTLTGFAYAGSFTTDFNTGGLAPPGTAVYGSASVDTTGGDNNNDGTLKLTTATTSQVGSFIVNDLDGGQRIGSFVVTFNLHMGNGSTPPADGISFNFATDLPNAPFDEQGIGSGLIISFDAYDNGYDNNSEGPELRVYFGGNPNPITRRKISTQFQTGTSYVPVAISYSSGGALTVAYNNIVLITNLFVFSPMAGGTRFGFGARTGGLYQEQWIDDLNITTSPIGANGFYIKGQVTPYPPVGISGASSFLVQFQDNGAVADPSSVAMFFNGAAVTPTVSKPASITTIGYTPHGALLPNSVNHMAINFSLSGNPTTLLYDFAVTNAPLWSLAPLSRPYLPLDPGTGGTPLYRSVGFNPFTQTNHFYVVSRTGASTGETVNVLDATTGADLYQMNVTGIASGTLNLVNIAVADDGAIYAANITATAASPLLTIYRWADDSASTAPTVVFSGDPGAGVSTNKRWGDSLAARGSGLNTQLILDCNSTSTSAILTPTNSTWVTNFTTTAFSHSYTTAGTALGRSLQFGPTNTYFLKKRSSVLTVGVPAMPLELIQTNTPPNTILLFSSSAFYGEIGPVTVDLSRNLAAGIMFVTNATYPDHLVVYDISNLASPLELAQYDFPVTHQVNNNMIGQVVIGPDKIFAVDGNNGIIAVPIAPSTSPSLQIAATGGSAVLSWTNTVPGFVLQSTPSVGAPSWSTVAQPVKENGLLNSVTDTPTSPTFYRLVK